MLTDAIFNFLNSILANFATDAIKRSMNTKNSTDVLLDQKDTQEIKQKDDKKTFPINVLYTSFYDSNDDLFVSLLDKIKEPNVYVFIETEASTFYNLGVVIVEDNRTKDWYLFDRPIAFQGTGGGWGNTKSFYHIVKKREDKDNSIVISIRIATNDNIEKLKNGYILWSDFKNYSIPAVTCKNEFLKQFQDRFEKEIVYKKIED